MRYILLILIFLMPFQAYAETKVVEGDEAKILLEEQKDSAPVLAQINKVFVLKKPGEESIENPMEITIEEDIYLFISNEEAKTVHNIYDLTDHSWVLKKQLPAGIAAIKFEEPGFHELRCAIHPGMKIKINVIAKK